MNEDYEAWRPALIAYYRACCMWGSAERIDQFGLPLSIWDREEIDRLRAAFAHVQHDERLAA